MSARKATITAILAAVAGALILLVAVVGWRMWAEVRTREVLSEQCDLDSTGSGWCVQHRHRPAGLVIDEEHTVYLVQRTAGTDSPRVTVAPYPFVDPGGPFTVSFRGQEIVVSDERGVTVLYPEAFYALD